MDEASPNTLVGSRDADMSDLRPACGELWTLEWDGETLGRVIVSADKQDYILGWPVSLPNEASFRPGILLDSPLGHEVTAWPTRETGIGKHLLGVCLGRLLPAETVRHISSALDEDEEVEVRWVDDWGTDEQEEAMADRWTAICFHTGRRDRDEMYLDEAKVKAAGGKAGLVSSLLSLEPEETRSLWLGEQPLTSEQARILAANLHVAPTDLLGPDPSLDLWLMLAEPAFKARVVQTSQVAGIPESEVRLTASRDAFTLAARDDSESRSRQKLWDALRRIALGGAS